MILIRFVDGFVDFVSPWNPCRDSESDWDFDFIFGFGIQIRILIPLSGSSNIRVSRFWIRVYIRILNPYHGYDFPQNPPSYCRFIVDYSRIDFSKKSQSLNSDVSWILESFCVSKLDFWKRIRESFLSKRVQVQGYEFFQALVSSLLDSDSQFHNIWTLNVLMQSRLERRTCSTEVCRVGR